MVLNNWEQVKNVIFDFDGVIANTDVGRHGILTTLLNEYGIDFANQVSVSDLVGKTSVIFLKEQYPQLSDTDLEDILSRRYEVYQSNLDEFCVPYAGAIETIKALSEAGYTLHIATTNPNYLIEVLLNHLNIRSYFDCVLGRSDTENPETKKKDYTQVLQKIGKPARECLVIEDSPSGIVAAVEAGVTCIGMERYPHPDIQRASYVATSFEPVCDLLLHKKSEV